MHNDKEHLVRQGKAIINNDEITRSVYLAKRELAKKERDRQQILESRINNMEDDLRQIKQLLLQIVENKI